MDVATSAEGEWDDSRGGDGRVRIDYLSNLLLVSSADLSANACSGGVINLSLNIINEPDRHGTVCEQFTV